MNRLNPYITFAGKTREALNFYQAIFGGEVTFMLVKETPPEVQAMCGEGTGELVMHGQLELNAFALMGSDLTQPGAPEDLGRQISIAIDCASKSEIEKFYNALGEGGSFGCPLGPAFWGGEFGLVTDKFGVSWMLTFTPEA